MFHNFCIRIVTRMGRIFTDSRITHLFAQILGAGEILANHKESMVVEISHDDLIVWTEAHTPWGIKMLPIPSFEAVFRHIFAIRGEKLNSMISRIAHQDTVSAITSHIPWVIKLPGFGPLLTESL